ncbi:MAG: MotA/TolQ/ExbB proton channel family protein [Myxococcota bacterium]
MNITEQFTNFALLGAEWVLWLLVGLSILSIGVMVERFLFFRSRQVDKQQLGDRVNKALRDDDIEALKKTYSDKQALPAMVAIRGLAERERGVDAVAEAMSSEKARVRQEYERYLIVLGTLGNNAPFIGLFGTVLGIIQALYDLSANPQGGADVVMSGIAEALVATAVGLLVAIPAVIAFNYYNRRVRDAVTTADDIAHTILAELHSQAHGEEAA